MLMNANDVPNLSPLTRVGKKRETEEGWGVVDGLCINRLLLCYALLNVWLTTKIRFHALSLMLPIPRRCAILTFAIIASVGNFPAPRLQGRDLTQHDSPDVQENVTLLQWQDNFNRFCTYCMLAIFWSILTSICCWSLLASVTLLLCISSHLWC